MYLDKVEIHGFKSFGETVKLEIPQGITAVIGPNGSGKSNVADAIRWVLGEQSAKTLRGTKMEDIIFAGTEKRKALGYAEVAIYIKNENRKLPIDYSDVVVKRRVYRSGESEYFLNGSTCRLRDIQELFMDTGVGKEGYSIIGQGQIDKVLSSKPEDRRSLFEEAAGIYKFKVRRLEAERKLDKERENILRLKDIISEIENRIEPLKIEAEKTREYLSLKDTLKEMDINIFIKEIGQIKIDINKVQEDIGNITGQIEENTVARERIGKEYTQWKHKKDQIFSSIESIIHAISDLEKKQQQKSSEIQINNERILSIKTLIVQIEQDNKKQEQDNKDMQIELQVLNSKKVGLELEKSTQQDILTKAEKGSLELRNQIQELENSLEDSKKQLYDKVREIDLLKNELDKQEAIEDQIDYRDMQLKESIQKLNSEVQHQETNLRVLQKKQEENTKQLSDVEEDFRQVDQTKMSLEAENSNKCRERDALSHNIAQAKRQISWLEQIKNDYEGYYHSVKQVLGLKKQSPSEWQGIIGIVADLLEVPEKYEIAIVTALGGAMQNIVTESEKDAKQMIATMKRKGISRVTFLPQDTIQTYAGIKDLASLKGQEGFLGLASELIKFESKYANIVDFLLGKILIVDTIDHASMIARKYNYRYKIVTLDGEVFNAGGSLSGGSSKNNKNNIFSRTRELKELKEEHQGYLQNHEELEKQIAQLKIDVESTLAQWDSLTKNIQELEEKRRELILQTSKGTDSLKLTKESQLQLVAEKNKLEELKENLNNDRDKATKQLEELENNVDDDKDAVTDLEKQINGLKHSHEKLGHELTEKKIALSYTTQNITYVIEQIQSIEKNIENTKEQNTSIVTRKEELLLDKEKIENNILLLQKQIEELEQKIIESNALKVKCEQDREQLDIEEEKIQERLDNVTETLSNLRQESFRLDNRKEILDLEKQKQSDNIWEQYELTYGGCLLFRKELGNLQEMKREVEKIRAKIKVIGSVNVNAIEQFEEASQRYEFLNAQKTDVEKAEGTLVELIDRLTEQMYAIFREQFTSIAANFSEVFKELFGGGTAFLQLTDEDNILESGIEIIAKPPGKKLQNMTLLSGGERTLTAIALVFGILKLKPSPFCVLDEIEAALDDANVIRFAEYLNSLSQETQFIVITHRKGTMERADTLYGVTMQERGISKVLSIKLEDATEYLDKKSS
ncbi:MAG: chromosome segregation protein SMC [Cellulosilyticaceae bacterium]